jgi:hypothetical protein
MGVQGTPASRARTMRASARSTMGASDPRGAQAVQCQQQDFQVGLQPGMAIDLGAKLQRLARGMRPVGAGVQHRAAVAQARDTLTVEQVGIDAGHLGRAVGAQAHHAARELVHQLEGLQVQRLAGAGEQRLQVLQQRRHHQLVAIAAGHVEQVAAEFFDVPGLGGQDIGNVIRQDPGRHGILGLLKRDFTGLAGPAAAGFQAISTSHSMSSPPSMLHRPKKRTWPSCSCSICWNMRRQPPATGGEQPSITSTRASASQKVSPSKAYYFFLAGAARTAAATEGA